MKSYRPMQCATSLLAFILILPGWLVADDAQVANIARLIQQLGADNFSDREAAANELLGIGEAARAALENAGKASSDREFRLQSQGVIKRLDRAALSSAVVHAVGVYSGRHTLYLIEPHGRRINWPVLCESLAIASGEKKQTPAKRIWELMGKDTQSIVTDARRVAAIDRWVNPSPDDEGRDRSGFKDCRRLCDDLSDILKTEDFYDPQYFDNVDLDPESKELLIRLKRLSQLETWLLNRRLLEASFPKAFPTLSFTLKTATIPVHVKASTRPVVLVFSSNGSVRWEVKADEGAIIKRIIVGGYHPQLVVGARTAVQYYVYDDPANVEQAFFYAYGRDKENYPKLVDFIRDLTGLGVSSFQGAQSASELTDGFVVPP